MLRSRKVLFFFLVLLSSLTGNSQNNLFETTIRSKSSYPSAIVDYYGKAWVVAGTFGYCKSGYIAMLDLNGEVKWEQGAPIGYGGFNDVTISPAGEIIAVGDDVGYDDVVLYKRSNIVKYDSSGNQLNHFYYDSDTTFGINDPYHAPGFSHVAANRSSLFVSLDSLLVKINHTGDTIWTKKLNGEITSIEVLNELLIVGAGSNIFKMDTSGNPLNMTGLLGTIVASATTNDNYLIYLTTQQTYKLDTSLNTMAAIPLPIALEQPLDIAAETDDYFILGSQLSTGYPYVLQFDSTLNLLTSHSDTIENENLTPVAIAANDSFFVVTGQERTYNTNRIFAKNFQYHTSQTLAGASDIGIITARIDSFSSDYVGTYPGPGNVSTNYYSIHFNAFATVKNFGSDTIYSFCLNSNRLEGVNCYHNVIFKCFNDTLPPGDSAEIDLGVTTISSFPAGSQVNICFYTTNPNDGIDINYDNDRSCQDLHYFVGIEPAVDPDIFIYPNPASEYFSVECKNIASPIELRLYNVNGQQVAFGLLANSMNQINIKHLVSGIYLYRITADDLSVLKTGKVIIE